jgi:redox-sensitive bicupin YhaK (pirin superfamily)
MLIDLTISPRDRDLGGFSVRRILPHAERRMVGPFVFLDHMGPADFPAGQGMDVRPHPHIGLATVTYLFEGEIIHRDSVGSDIAITPGAVNWMTAGAGIAHSERTGADERARPHVAHGLQSWVALPREFEETAPEFHHHAAGALPEFEAQGVVFRVVAGSAFGHESPAKIHSPLFYVEARMKAGASFVMPKQYAERALYLVEGRLRVGNEEIAPRTMPVFADGETIAVEALAPSRAMLLGGDPLPEQRFIDWNFVSSSRERIEQAKADWRAGKFPKVRGDETEFIPLP